MSEMIDRVVEAARRSMMLRDPNAKEIQADDISNALYVLRFPTDTMFVAGMEALIAPLGRKNAMLVCNYIWQAMIKAMLSEVRDVKGREVG